MGVGRRSKRLAASREAAKDLAQADDEVEAFHRERDRRGRAHARGSLRFAHEDAEDDADSDGADSMSSLSEEAILDIGDDSDDDSLDSESQSDGDHEEEEEEEEEEAPRRGRSKAKESAKKSKKKKAEEEDDEGKSSKRKSSRIKSKKLLEAMEQQQDLLERDMRVSRGESYGESSDEEDGSGKSGDDEDASGDSAGEDENWGRNKKAYYQRGDGVGEDGAARAEQDLDDDFDERAEEEEEARRIQTKQATRLADADFDLDEDDEDEGSEGDDGDDDGEGAALKSALSREDQLAAIEGDTPELSSLLSELKASLEEITKVVEPTLQAVKKAKAGGQRAKTGDVVADALQSLRGKNGLSFIESKYTLMLSYCCHIVFYLMMKCEGKSVAKHPLLGRLVEIRTYLEKIRPIEKKMNYQIQKLVTQASRKEEEGAAAGGADPLRFRPRPDALARAGDLANGGAAEADEDGRYVAPKIAPMHYESESEGEDAFEDPEKAAVQSSKALKRKKHERKKALRSEYVQHLVSELGDRPEEIGTDSQTQSGSRSAFAKREEQRMKLRGEQEEELFTRTPLTKMEKKRLQAAKRSGFTGSSISILDDLGAADIADFAIEDGVEDGGFGGGGSGKSRQKSEMDAYLEEKRRGKKSARMRDPLDGMEGLLGDSAGRGRGKSGDEDFPTQSLGDRRARHDAAHAKKRARESFDREDAAGDLMGMGVDEGGFDAGDERDYELYASAKQRNEASKSAKKSRRQSKTSMHHPPLAEEQVDGKRQINYQIEKNRGLTPRRNKDLKNPRKKHRIKYGKAVIRRKGQVQDQRERRDTYGGEATGIKTRVTKSVKL